MAEKKHFIFEIETNANLKIKAMNIKVLAWIIIVLILGTIAILLFVPKKIDTVNSKITTFGKPAPTVIEEETEV